MTRALLLAAAITSSLILIAFLQMDAPEPAPCDPPAPATIAYEPHTPIHIVGNDGFLGANTSTGIVWGSGTESDPYIISGWHIDTPASLGSITIENSDVHFVVTDCNLTGSSYGIYLCCVSNGIITGNVISGCDLNGIVVLDSDYNTLDHNNCSNNGVGGIRLITSSYNVVCNNDFSNSGDYGMFVESSSNSNTLSNNNCSGNKKGIYMHSSNDNTMIDNNCSWAEYGIAVYFSDHNSLINNNCSENDVCGIFLHSSNHNTLTWNQLCDNTGFGIHIGSGSSSNRVWNSVLIANNGAGCPYDSDHIQARDDGTGNWWNTTEGAGNYWSDWTDPYSPYVLAGTAGAMDHYPRAEPLFIPELSSGIVLVSAMVAMLAVVIGMRRLRERQR